MPITPISSSFVALLRSTAATATCAANASRSAENQRLMACSFNENGRFRSRRAATCVERGRDRASTLRRRALRRNQTFDIVRNALLDIEHRCVETGLAQRADVGLR